MVRLSQRLQRMADEVRPGDRVADIGTDHGLLPIFLYESRIASKLILCDIREGPLEKARENIRTHGAVGITDLRRGDGLDPLVLGEVDTIIIAGMGGLLIAEILAQNPEKAGSCSRLILQPRNAADKLRKFLMENGYSIAKESLVREGNYICQIVTAVPGGLGKPQDKEGAEITVATSGLKERPSQETDTLLELEISPMLFEEKDRLLVPFIEKKIQIEQDIVENIIGGRGRDEQRLKLAEKRLSELFRLLEKARELQ